MLSRSISVVWNCEKGEDCVNLQHPGQHGGDKGHDDAVFCVTGVYPQTKALEEAVKPVLDPPADTAAETIYGQTYER